MIVGLNNGYGFRLTFYDDLFFLLKALSWIFINQFLKKRIGDSFFKMLVIKINKLSFINPINLIRDEIG